MAHDITIDGYYLNDSGEWEPNDDGDSGDSQGTCDGDSNNDQSLPQWAKDRIAKYTEQLNSGNIHEKEDIVRTE